MKKSIVIQFGKQIRTLRLKCGLTQEELAAKSNISLKYIQRIEGKTPPNLGIESIDKLANGLDIPIWKLFKIND